MTEKALQVTLGVVAAYHLVMGALALLAPGMFFEEIGDYGVENLHYVGDVGSFFLAFGVAVGVAVVRPGWRAPLLWLGAAWYGFHALNHAFDVGEARSEGRGWADTLLLAIGALGAAWLARASEAIGRRASGVRDEDVSGPSPGGRR